MDNRTLGQLAGVAVQDLTILDPIAWFLARNPHLDPKHTGVETLGGSIRELLFATSGTSTYLHPDFRPVLVEIALCTSGDPDIWCMVLLKLVGFQYFMSLATETHQVPTGSALDADQTDQEREAREPSPSVAC